MFKYTDFEKELKKDNSHYERFKTSSLHALVELLKRKMPKATAYEVEKEMKKIPQKKWTKYSNTQKYLVKNFPNLKALASSASVGQSTPGYSPGKWSRTRDVDGSWHQYILQQKGNSCGPACVTMLKILKHPNAKGKLSENQVRGVVALYESGKENTGISSISPEAIGLHRWKTVGSNRAPLLKTLLGQPYPVAKARAATNLAPDKMLEELNKCTKSTPAILGWNWRNGGGHWTLCIGPTKDKSKLIILDPWTGVEYLTNTLADYQDYQNGAGTLDLSDPTFTH